MTRFNILLSEGVSFVINSFKNMCGGELFVPKIPSYNIIDMAKAIDPNCSLKFIGIRPGEKIHEEMITESDSFNTFDVGDFYIIASPILMNEVENHYKKLKIKIIKVQEGFKYNSGENSHFLSIKEIRDLYSDYLKNF
jgi:FlaA1/EpsC-like NDP-sugar epimerase